MLPKRKSGFTLVELLIVVIILGILAAVVVPQFSGASEDAKEAAVMTNLQTLRGAIEMYYVQHNDTYPGTIGGASNWANFITHLTTQTDVNGDPDTKYGPYIRSKMPRNPFKRKDRRLGALLVEFKALRALRGPAESQAARLALLGSIADLKVRTMDAVDKLGARDHAAIRAARDRLQALALIEVEVRARLA